MIGAYLNNFSNQFQPMTTNVEIIETGKFDLKNPLLIEGFPGIGLIGTISASYIAEKLGMEQIGYMVSEKFPPITAVHNYEPLYPARIYKSKKHNLIVLFSEFVVPISVVHKLAHAIVEWSMKRKIKQIISLGGIGMKGEQDTVFGIASQPQLTKMLEKNGIKLIKEGATTGVSGVMLAECAARKVPAISLLAEAKPNYLDPKGAALVLNAVKKITGLPIDTRELVKEADTIETKIKEIIENAKDAQQHYEKTTQIGPMYG